MFSSLMNSSVDTTSITSSTTAGSMDIASTLICMAVAIVLGIFISFIYQKSTEKYSKNFVVTLAMLPVLVQVVIMLVNGNLGTSVAILGAFSLVRFRSAQGNAKEIGMVFFAMAVGLASGVGYMTFAIFFTVLVSLLYYLLNKLNFGGKREDYQMLKITIPESLDYTEAFDDLFEKYTKASSLEKVKTTNMGSMYELTYKIMMNDISEQKVFIDEIRCRNGNLTVMCARPVSPECEL